MSEKQMLRPSSSLGDSSFKPENVIEGGSELSVQEDSVHGEQIIMIPEILSMILSLVDFRTLKRASLVSRSWQREARLYMRKRGILQLECRKTQCDKFLETYQSRLQDLPQPFRSVDVLGLYSASASPQSLIVSQLSSFCPPLLITRFNTCQFPLNLLLPLILESSPNLEALELFCGNFEGDEFIPPMDPMDRINFPKLRQMTVSTLFCSQERNQFPSFVAWIVGASPEMETFYSCGSVSSGMEDRLAIELLMKVNIQNVRSLELSHSGMSRGVLEHVGSIRFCHLEKLNMRLEPVDGIWEGREVLLATLANCATTLRVLDLGTVLRADDLEFLPAAPVCPVLQDLYSNRFLGSLNFLAGRFPALTALNVSEFCDVDVFGTLWRDLSPCFGVKTLRVSRLSFRRGNNAVDSDLEPLKFFEKFPALETVQLSPSFLLRCCRLKASGDPRFSNMLERVKHLEFRRLDFQSKRHFDSGPSSLPVLKGIETITVVSVFDAGSIQFPYSDMPNLKVFRFPWMMGNYSIMDKLLEIARSVGKVILTNCCKTYWSQEPRVKSSLEEFLKSSPNAECGCKEFESRSSLNWY